MFKASDF
jgi:Ca2+-binding EF-hand superfamily protein